MFRGKLLGGYDLDIANMEQCQRLTKSMTSIQVSTLHNCLPSAVSLCASAQSRQEEMRVKFTVFPAAQLLELRGALRPVLIQAPVISAMLYNGPCNCSGCYFTYDSGYRQR